MNNQLDEFRARLFAINQLSREMLGRVDELKYHVDYFDPEDDTTRGIIEYLHHFLETDYHRLKGVCQETTLPDKEQLTNDPNS